MTKINVGQSSVFLSVSSTDSWYKGLTSVFRDIEMYPKFRSINANFSEIVFLVHTSNQRDLIRRIDNLLLKKNVKNVLVLSQDYNNLLVYCTVKNREKSLTSSFSKFYDLYGLDYFWKVKNGKEEWLFSGPEDNIRTLKEKIDERGLGNTLIIEQGHETKYELEKQRSLFKALGLNEELSVVLALAKIKGLLDNPKDKKLQTSLGRMLGISPQQLMCMVEDGVVKSMWIVDAIHNMEKKLYLNRKGFTGDEVKEFFSNYLIDTQSIQEKCSRDYVSPKENASLTNLISTYEKPYSQVSVHVISNLITMTMYVIRNYNIIKKKLQTVLVRKP